MDNDQEIRDLMARLVRMVNLLCDGMHDCEYCILALEPDGCQIVEVNKTARRLGIEVADG